MGDLLDMVQYIKGQLIMIQAVVQMNPKMEPLLDNQRETLETQLQICRAEISSIHSRKEIDAIKGHGSRHELELPKLEKIKLDAEPVTRSRPPSKKKKAPKK